MVTCECDMIDTVTVTVCVCVSNHRLLHSNGIVYLSFDSTGGGYDSVCDDGDNLL